MDFLNYNRALVVGHSFIKRLKHDMNRGLIPQNLGLSWCKVRMLGIGGLTADYLKVRSEKMMKEFRPHIVYIEIGCNDLSEGIGPEVVGSEIDEYVSWLLDLGIRKVLVGQLIFQENDPPDVPDYNDKVIILNKYLKAVINDKESALFWAHRGMWRPSSPVLGKDGLHLSEYGQKQLFRSIRGALIHAASKKM